jgi:hypothetical protein
MAEITLSHLLRLAKEQGCIVSREQAVAFSIKKGMRTMQAGEDFIERGLLGQCISSECASVVVSVHMLRM